MTARQTGSLSHLPVIALCASAGGLEAFRAFFEAMPEQSGLAFIVVQHLADSQENLLPMVLERYTNINVVLITDNTPLEPDHTYVLPAGYYLDLWNGHLRLTTRKQKDRGWPNTIDQFLKSLAKDQGRHAAALIFSGAGSDGLEGARAIHKHGGLVIVQELASATQTSMPAHVLDAQLADVVTAPELMPGVLLAHFNDAQTEPVAFQAVPISEDDMLQVVRRLQRLAGRDFSDYKRSTFERQLRRRMGICQVRTVNDYLEFMDREPAEAQELAKSLLINVSSFFRDAEAFEVLKKKAILPALQSLQPETIFRAWVPGCATGEEAVSIAILVHECLEELGMTDMEIRIFATDVSPDVIQKARTGFYPLSIKNDISTARLAKHFYREEDGYQVRKHISQMIMWSVHNLTEHPPLSKQHLISCRNVLIYFQQNLQEQLIALFTFSLLPQGVLFLGSSETLSALQDYYTVVDSKHKIYRRTEGATVNWLRLDQPLNIKVPEYWETRMPTDDQTRGLAEDRELEAIKNMLVQHYQSTCAIVDDKHRLRYTYGDIDQYLKIVPGRDGRHTIDEMAREGLDLELTAALYIAENEGQPVTRKGVQVNFNSKHRVINLTVKPIDSNVLPGDQTLIIFEPVEGGDEWPHDRNATEELGSEEIYELHNELRQSQEALQTVTEALQIKRKELTSSLKEVRAVSEEVQTTNEELRTSKEELESMNEELNTLNNQLTDQNYELSRANNTLHNFLQSTEIGMIFLDESLNIREFTAAVTDIFKLREVDKGRPLAEIVHKLEYDALIDEAESVLNTLTTIEKEVHTTTGQWYKLHIRPYRTTTGNIDGLVLTFSDITQQKQAQRAAKQQAHYISQIFNLVDHSIIELDREMRVLSADPSFYDSFGLSEEDTIGKMLFELGDGDWDIPDLRRLLDEIIPDLKEVRHHPVEHEFRNRGPCKLQFNALLVPDLDRVLLIISDLTKT